MINYKNALSVIVALLGLLIVCPQVSFGQDPLPNIIVIFTDDLGFGDLGCYGHPTIQTPHLDRMAQEGIRFTQFYAAASVCTPSRAGLLTGRYPVRTGMVGGILPGRVLFPNDQTGLPLHEETIAEMLRQKNYATKAIGKWHLGHLPAYLPTAQGFDSYFGIPYSNDMDFVAPKDGKEGYWNVPLMRDTTIIERPADQSTLTKRYTQESMQFIKEHRDQPFFLYLAHTMPHIPLFRSRAFAHTSARGLYGDVIEEIDWSVGQILEQIKTLDLDQRTLILFTSDNGPWLIKKQNGGSAGLLREGKGVTWDGGMRVPMIAWWPGRIPAGRVSHQLMTTLDILPTIAALTGTQPTAPVLDGKNMESVLTHLAPSPREDFIFYRGDRVFAVRHGPWKGHFITQTAYPAGQMEFHDPPLLYHLENDPGEHFNLAPENPEVVERLLAIKARHEATIPAHRKPAIEAEDLMQVASVTGGTLRVQQMGDFPGEWSGGAQLWWIGAQPGDAMTLPFTVATSGHYHLFGFFTRAKDYGIIRLKVDGQAVGDLIDCFADTVEPTGPLQIGDVYLEAGQHSLIVQLVGKDIRASGYSGGYLVGVDGFSFWK